MDFYKIREEVVEGKKKTVINVYPDFVVKPTKDLMIRGKAFYAIWDEANHIWSTDESDVARLVDDDLWNYKPKNDIYDKLNVKTMAEFSSKSWVNYRNYIYRMFDTYHPLDEKLAFAGTKLKKSDYCSKRLSYNLEKGSIEAYDKIASTLYSPEERQKFEWAIGSIIAGDGKDIQKFLVFYGGPGTGKSTILNIIQKLFEGYCVTFDAKALGSSSSAFSTEVFKTNPLVAIQHDGDLSKIDDNTKLNSISAHEEVIINEKHKSTYAMKLNCFLFMGTNKPVKITDAKSGILRRLIDIHPSGNRIPEDAYFALMDQVGYELGAIAYHCLQVYRKLGKNYYMGYRPLDMQIQTDVFFNFMDEYYDEFCKEDGVSLKVAYEMYVHYCESSNINYKLAMYLFREELKDYFEEFYERCRVDGKQIRSYYKGLKKDKFNPFVTSGKDLSDEFEETKKPSWIVLDKSESLFDIQYADWPAQEAVYKNGRSKPAVRWSECKTTLKDIDTKVEHYVKPLDRQLIFLDFDLKNPDGSKSYEKNVEAATKFPPTYAETSKSGSGLHLYYIYTGDVDRLMRVFDTDIEIKVCTGDASIRRKLIRCNDIPIATLGSGLPLKEEKKMIDIKTVKSEKKLRELIERNLRKEIHPGTKPSVDFICKIVEDAYESGLHYDISDMKNEIIAFANHSTHWASYCVSQVLKIHYHSDDVSDTIDIYDDDRLVFYDVEVFPNLLLVNWKYEGENEKCVRMINPKPIDIEKLISFKLVGFNCRRYDNHILYARLIGKSNEEIYELSQKIISNKSSNCFFREAYNISYTDVYDFCSKKQSLKKWEIELGIHHQELGLPWDKPVPEELWEKVAEYCDNDVIATEAVFNNRHADWVARQILADLSGLTVNDTTNNHIIKILVGNDKHPELVYTDLATGKGTDGITDESNAFPGYSFENGKNMYRGEDLGRGGWVDAEPGIWRNVALLDVGNMHGASILKLRKFGENTKNYRDIREARMLIKHGQYEDAKQMFGGKLTKYLDDPKEADKLQAALKLVLNSTYGISAATFDNPLRDIRDENNIIALRGALFMRTLKDELIAKGYPGIHYKTDSVKIPNATNDIIQFVIEFGRRYGYEFEHEATYDRMCLVNDAVYIAKYMDPQKCTDIYGYVPGDNRKHYDEHGGWTATGTQFQVPYVFKQLFSKEAVEFDDLCETKSVSKGTLYLDMNEGYPDVSKEEKELTKLMREIGNQMAATYDIWTVPKLTEEDYKNTCPILWKEKEDLEKKIAEGHNYVFVGRVGQFCPVKEGTGGGVLLREQDRKYYAATGTKGYRWKESEVVKKLGIEDQIDKSYYNKLADEAIAAINEYGDFYEFVNDTELDLYSDELPF